MQIAMESVILAMEAKGIWKKAKNECERLRP
jgi:hypothetical protein